MKFSIYNEKNVNRNPEKVLQGAELDSLKNAAMDFTMRATGINRIHSKEDMREFLFRIALSFRMHHPMESWKKSGVFFMINYEDNQYPFAQDDVENHYGFQAIDSLENFLPRATYLKKIVRLLRNAKTIYILKNYFNNEGEGEFEKSLSSFTAEELAVNVTNITLVIEAEAFADDVIKTIPTALWSEKTEEIEAKKQEIIMRKNKVSMLPAFDIKSIPADVIKKCAEVVYVDEDIEEYLKDDFSFSLYVEPYVYLAWLQANGHLHYTGDGWYDVTEGYELNYDDYNRLDEGGLTNIVNTYNFEHLYPLFKSC